MPYSSKICQNISDAIKPDLLFELCKSKNLDTTSWNYKERYNTKGGSLMFLIIFNQRFYFQTLIERH